MPTELLATCWTHAGDAMPVPGRHLSPVDLRARAEAVAAAGFTGIGFTIDDLDAAKATYEKAKVPMETLQERIAHVVQACFAGKRLVVFSGGEAKGTEGLLEDVRQIRDGGGSGSIIGRNSFQRPHQQALELLDQVVKIYLG